MFWLAILRAPDSEFGNKNSFAKKSERSEENSMSETEAFLGFERCFSKFTRGIYKTCYCNFFNLAIIIVIVFSIIQFILFLRFADNN